MNKRKLASIQRIDDLKAIPGADRIEVASILGWKVVVRKGEFVVGDKCMYFEIDSVLPDKPWSAFLKSSKRPDAPIRLRTMKLKKQVSQGLAIPLSIFSDNFTFGLMTGWDATDELGVTKYEPKVPTCLAGTVKGGFPVFIKKTDEERIQNLPEMFDEYSDKLFYITEKLDGCSATFFIRDGMFGVCSRNLELKEAEDPTQEKNAFWKIARGLGIENKLRGSGYSDVAIQGELVGPGIQGNPLKLDTKKFFVFNLFDITSFENLARNELRHFCDKVGLDAVPVIRDSYRLGSDMDTIIAMSDGQSALADVPREGIVCRLLTDSNVSFKAVSNDYLLKNRSK